MSSLAKLPDPYRVTYADWLRFPEDGRLYEIFAGELYVSPPPTTRHQRIARNLGFLLDSYLRQSSRGEILYAPTGVKLAEEDVLEPDLIVVLSEHAGRVQEACIVGPPDLVVEILSPGSAGRDLGVKRRLYESNGVPEYWIVDPVKSTVEVLALAAGSYRRAGLYHRDETFDSPSLAGLSILLSEVFP